VLPHRDDQARGIHFVAIVLKRVLSSRSSDVQPQIHDERMALIASNQLAAFDLHPKAVPKKNSTAEPVLRVTGPNLDAGIRKPFARSSNLTKC
jgi:hypothetical protein